MAWIPSPLTQTVTPGGDRHRRFQATGHRRMRARIYRATRRVSNSAVAAAGSAPAPPNE
jgi:hypothetical protein